MGGIVSSSARLLSGDLFKFSGGDVSHSEPGGVGPLCVEVGSQG